MLGPVSAVLLMFQQRPRAARALLQLALISFVIAVNHGWMLCVRCVCFQSDESSSDDDTADGAIRKRRLRPCEAFAPPDEWIHRSAYWHRAWSGAGESASFGVPKHVRPRNANGHVRVRRPTWAPSSQPRLREYYTAQRRERSSAAHATLVRSLISPQLVELILRFATVSNRPKHQLFKDLVKEMAESAEPERAALSPRSKLREAKKIDDEIRRLPVDGGDSLICVE